jgi:hypothetical protein
MPLIAGVAAKGVTKNLKILETKGIGLPKVWVKSDLSPKGPTFAGLCPRDTNTPLPPRLSLESQAAFPLF